MIENLKIKFHSVVKCPICGFKEKQRMPGYAVKTGLECAKCKHTSFVTENQCCIYCSYGSVPCPTGQMKVFNGKTEKMDHFLIHETMPVNDSK